MVVTDDSSLEDNLVAWRTKEELSVFTVKAFGQAMIGAGCAGTVATDVGG